MHKHKVLSKASSRSNTWSSMTADFARPASMASQMSITHCLFATSADLDPSDMSAMADYLCRAEREIDKEFGANDFLKDRLSRSGRAAKGMDISKRQYNQNGSGLPHAWNATFAGDSRQLKRSLTLTSKSRLASRLNSMIFLMQTLLASLHITSRVQFTKCFHEPIAIGTAI